MDPCTKIAVALPEEQSTHPASVLNLQPPNLQPLMPKGLGNLQTVPNVSESNRQSDGRLGQGNPHIGPHVLGSHSQSNHFPNVYGSNSQSCDRLFQGNLQTFPNVPGSNSQWEGRLDHGNPHIGPHVLGSSSQSNHFPNVSGSNSQPHGVLGQGNPQIPNAQSNCKLIGECRSVIFSLIIECAYFHSD